MGESDNAPKRAPTLQMLWRLIVAVIMALLAVLFAASSGSNAGEALDPYDISWQGRVLLSALTGLLSAIAVALASYCRSRRAIMGLTLCCLGSWLLWAFVSWRADLAPQQSSRLVYGCAGVGATVLAAVALWELRNGRGDRSEE